MQAAQEIAGTDNSKQNLNQILSDSLRESRKLATCAINIDMSSMDNKSQNVISDTEKTFVFPITDNGLCALAAGQSLVFQVTVSPDSTSGPIDSDPSTPKVDVKCAQSNSIGDAGVYQVTVTFWIDTNPQCTRWRWGYCMRWAQTNSYVQVGTNQATYSYLDPCLKTTIALPNPPDITTTVLLQSTSGSPSYTHSTASATDTFSQLYPTISGGQVCGPFQYSIQITSPSTVLLINPTELSIDLNSGVINVYTPDKDKVGIYTATVTANLKNYSVVTSATATLQIKIDPCVVKSFTMNLPSSQFDQTYYILQSTTWQIDGSLVTTQNPPCGYDQILTVSSLPPFVNEISGPKIDFTAHSTSFSDQNEYNIDVTSTLQGLNFDSSTCVITQQQSFKLKAIASCDKSPTNLIAPTLIDMMTSVLVQDASGSKAFVTQLVMFEDSISKQLGNGIDKCGPRLYSITSTPSSGVSAQLSSTELIIDSSTGLISLYTANKNTVGTHTATVTAKLKDYASVAPVTAQFQIEIQACIVTAFSMNTLPTQIYTIGDQLIMWQFMGSQITTQVPPCGYTQTLASTGHPAFIPTPIPNSILSYYVQSNDVRNADTYFITITSTLNNPPYNTVATHSTKQFQAIVTNPCKMAQIQKFPTSIQNLVTFAGYSITSQEKYNLTDDVSVFRAQISVDGRDFCGEKQFLFTLNDTQTSLLTYNNPDKIHFSPHADTKDFGAGYATVKAVMISYPLIQTPTLSFTATILGSVVPVIANQKYTQNQATLAIPFEPFKVLPLDYEVGPSTVNAYIYTGGPIIDRVDPTCICMTNVADVDWITLDARKHSIQVQTSNSDYVGDHKIILVQSFENFAEVYPFSAFLLTIDAEVSKFQVKKPPYFQTELTTQIITQCSNSTYEPWYFQLPKIVDPQDSAFSLEVFLNEKYLKFDNTSQKITQVKMFDSPSNQTVKFRLKNELNVSGIYTMKVQFVCPEHVVTSNYSLKELKITESLVKVPNPVKIISISRGGLVDMHFYLAVLVPNFTQPAHQSSKVRQLSSEQQLTTPQQYINEQVLQVQIKTKFENKQVDWWCIGFTNQTIKLQLNFTNPMEISQDHQDKLLVKFLQTDLFVLSSRSEYLFQNGSSKYLVFNIPPQLPSNTTAAFFASMSASVQQVGVTVIAVTLIIQIVAKKVITSMWLYYCALQIVILLVLHSNMYPPASVDMVISSISGIINLSSLDKKQIASFLHLDVITNSSVFQSLDGVALSAIGILLLILVIGIMIVISKKFPKVHEFFMKLKNTIFWNFLIRYFQASFIGFNFVALTVVQEAGGGLSDIGSSISILILQYGVVLFIAQLMLRKQLSELSKPTTRSRIGNLYFNLDTRQRFKFMFGLIFFVQRALLVLLLAIKYDFAIQWQLCQAVLLLNTVYILAAKPYFDNENATLDNMNCFFLIAICVLISTYSAWNTNTYDRFLYGVLFDAFVVLQFLFNMAFVAGQVFASFGPKIKQIRFRLNQRKRLKANRLMKLRQAEEQSLRVASLQEKTIALKQLKNQVARLRNEPQQNIQQQLEQLGPSNVQSYTEEGSLIQDKAEQKVKVGQRRNNISTRKTSQKRKWRPPTPGPMSSRNIKEAKNSVVLGFGENHLNPNRSAIRLKETLRMVEMLKAKFPSKPNQPVDDFLQQHVKIQSGGTNQSGIKAFSNEVTATSNPANCRQIIQRSQLVNQVKQQESLQEDQQIITHSQPRPSIFTPQKLYFERLQERKHHNPKEVLPQYQNHQSQPGLVKAKIKQQLLFTFLQWKVSPQTVNLKVAVSREKQKLESSEREFLEKASANYFAQDSLQVRQYRFDEKQFTWVDDVWPFYRQSIEHNYSGPIISEQQHREYIKVHLYKEWVREYPKMPHLPLLVSVKLYFEICAEIKPHVIQHLAATRQQHF